MRPLLALLAALSAFGCSSRADVPDALVREFDARLAREHMDIPSLDGEKVMQAIGRANDELDEARSAAADERWNAAATRALHDATRMQALSTNGSLLEAAAGTHEALLATQILADSVSHAHLDHDTRETIRSYLRTVGATSDALPYRIVLWEGAAHIYLSELARGEGLTDEGQRISHLRLFLRLAARLERDLIRGYTGAVAVRAACDENPPSESFCKSLQRLVQERRQLRARAADILARLDDTREQH